MINTYKVNYAHDNHKDFPHVVKFSGGRSSGMLLFILLKNGLLSAERGDVVVFNNTSAEHSATYKFVTECKERCEKDYGIPFFITEFATYEDCAKGVYTRFSTYKLVNEKPFSKHNPDGYHYKGEVFEEVVSKSGYLPNKHKSRTCTLEMKLKVSNQFLRDWFSNSAQIDRLGHFGKSSRIDEDEIYKLHLRHSGSTPKEIYLSKKKFSWSRPLSRPEQNFLDFSIVGKSKVTNPMIIDNTLSKVDLEYGEVEYCNFIGFRYDEPRRLAKMKKRVMEESENDDLSYVATGMGEHIYVPLCELEITNKDVAEFWSNQGWDLDLPNNGEMSNCVYCFMKGNKLLNIAKDEKPLLGNKDLTPENILWWANLEEKYRRDLVAENREIRSNNKSNPYIGFFGRSSQMSYRILDNLKDMSQINKATNIENIEELNSLPCDCTD
ncbi:MAG TPA: hypothetical protein EYQ06_02480 [Flavobacteriales bacterium]|nr:hypothetical protein [Flavobacteriales bacterium]